MSEANEPPDLIQVFAASQAELAPGLVHHELYTRHGLLTLLWHGDPGAERVLVCCGGAMGSLLGPAYGLYHDLGLALGHHGIGVIRVGYRAPNHFERCVADVRVAVQSAVGNGAARAVTLGHSFGGAVAICAAIEEPETVAGVVTLATQSAGCEMAAMLGGRPLLLMHGASDTILPVAASEVVRMMAGHGELVVLEGTGHGMAEAAVEIRARLLEWIPAVLA